LVPRAGRVTRYFVLLRATGSKIRALCRPGSRIESGPQLDVLSGEVTSADDVERTIEATQGVIGVFGPRPPYAEVFCARATQTVVEAMVSRRVSPKARQSAASGPVRISA
jgi:hypothetical protein